MNHLSEHTKTDRNRFTRMCIGEAFVDLLKHEPFSSVRISDIVTRAGISRMTYYHYYHSKSEVLSDYLQEIVKAYIFETTQKKDIGTFHEYTHILHCLHFFQQYTDFFLTLVHAGLYSIIIDAINEYMMTQVYPDYHGSVYELYYYSGAILNLFIQWNLQDKPETPEELAKTISAFVH